MKKLSILMHLLVVALAASMIVACAKNDGGNGGEALPVPPIAPQLNFSGGKIAFYAQNTKMDRLYANNGTSYNLQSGMNSVLKTAMRTCDRAHANGGFVTCTSYMSGFNDIMLFSNGAQANSVQLVLRSMPDTTCQNPYYCSNYWYSLPSFKQVILGMFGFNTFNYSNIYNPMVLTMSIWPINGGKGFELRGNAPGGDLYYNSGGLLFQFQVAQGKLEDLSWDFRLIFNGTVAASGRMVRCPLANCGVTGF